MPLTPVTAPQGRVVVLEHTSQVLSGNPLGDPHVRPLHVWLPPQYDAPGSADARYPVLFDLVGYTGSGPIHTGWKAFGENVPQRAARLIHEGKMPPVIIVFPDCYTAFAGNQYVNSSAIGRYADYLVQELIPYVDAQFRTLASREHRGCFGKSSGGYGAIVHGMRYSQHWGAVADHSGDAYFEFVYQRDWPTALDMLTKYTQPKRAAGPIDVVAREKGVETGLDDGRVAAFLADARSGRKLARDEVTTLMMLGMAATYDPDPAVPNGFRIPHNLETGERIESHWATWLTQDPIHMAAQHADALRSLRGIYIDCGWRDQFSIHYGTRILSKRLAGLGIAHVYEEFDDDHSDVDHRMDVSLPFLARALSPRG